jgi:hypothetical protein
MISLGGTGKTKFPSNIVLRGESEKKLNNQFGFQAAFHPLAPILTQQTPSPKLVQRWVHSFVYDFIGGARKD